MQLIFAFLSIILAGVLFFLSMRQRQTSGVPRGNIIYSDTSRWSVVEQPLFDPDLNLTGKPDYLVEDGEEIIPVEVKSARGVKVPYDSHIYQLAVYCLLVESRFGRRPSYGILNYPDKTFSIEYTDKLENALYTVIDDIRAAEQQQRVDRYHTEPNRCKSCGFRSICDQRIG